MKKPVLIVDDGKGSLKPLAAALSKTDYLVRSCDATDAVDTFAESAPELIFIQLTEGGGTGVTVAEQVRQRADGALVPILLVGSGQEMITSVSDALAVGGDYYFQHPLDLEKVLGKVKAYIGVSAAPNEDEVTRPNLSVNETWEDFDFKVGEEDPAGGGKRKWVEDQVRSEQEAAKRLGSETGAGPSGPAVRDQVERHQAEARRKEEQALREAQARAQRQAELLAKKHEEALAELEKKRELDAAVERQAVEERVRRQIEAELRAKADKEAAERTEADRLRAERVEAETRLRIEAEMRAAAERKWREAEAQRAEQQKEEQRRLEEAAQKRVDDEAKKRLDEEAQRRRLEEAQKKAETDAQRRAEEEQKRMRAEADALRRQAEEQQKRIEDEVRQRLETEFKRKAGIIDLPQPASDPDVDNLRVQPPREQAGQLSEHHVAFVFGLMAIERVSGKVIFQRGSVEKVVAFERGAPVAMASSDPMDRFEEFLLRQHLLTRSQYQTCRMRQLGGSRQTGAFIVGEGYLKPEELFDAVRRHLEDCVHGLFEWEDGSWLYRPELASPDDRVVLTTPAERLIVEGVRRRYLLPRMIKLLGAPSSLLVPSGDWHPEKLGIDGKERGLYKLLDGTRSIEDLVFSSGLSEERVYQLFCALEALGLLQVAVRGSQVGEGVASEHIDRARITERFELAKKADYFEFLGLSEKATEFEIERALAGMRKVFGKERFASHVAGELSLELAEIERVLGDAEYVLRDNRLRETYVQHLRRPP